jgi:hypothetical protein
MFSKLFFNKIHRVLGVKWSNERCNQSIIKIGKGLNIQAKSPPHKDNVLQTHEIWYSLIDTQLVMHINAGSRHFDYLYVWRHFRQVFFLSWSFFVDSYVPKLQVTWPVFVQKIQSNSMKIPHIRKRKSQSNLITNFSLKFSKKLSLITKKASFSQNSRNF